MPGLTLLLSTTAAAQYFFIKRMISLKTILEANRAPRFKTSLKGTVLDLPKSKYGGRHTVTMLPGAGIGPELMGYVKEVFSFAGVPVDFEEIEFDPKSKSGEDLKNAIVSIKRNRAAIKGNLEVRNLGISIESQNVALRNELDLYIDVLHCKSYPGIHTRHKNLDIVIMRQNTEGEYAMLEHQSVKGVVESLKVVTRENTERVARFAFDYAKRNGRKKVTTVHKANIMKLSDGLFLKIAREVSKDYPEIEHKDIIVDNCCMQLVTNPHQFDVLITTNLYGAIVSNILCGLIGGGGLISGKNYSDYYAVFETATRSIAAEIRGKNVANPVAMLNASVDLLRHLGQNYHADIIHQAINKTINEKLIHPRDIGGTATSRDVVENIKKEIEAAAKLHSWTEGHVASSSPDLPKGDNSLSPVTNDAHRVLKFSM